jgi:hypothetical protein
MKMQVQNDGTPIALGCIGIIKDLLGGRVKRYGFLVAPLVAACAPLRGPSFKLGRPDGRTGLF